MLFDLALEKREVVRPVVRGPPRCWGLVTVRSFLVGSWSELTLREPNDHQSAPRLPRTWTRETTAFGKLRVPRLVESEDPRNRKSLSIRRLAFRGESRRDRRGAALMKALERGMKLMYTYLIVISLVSQQGEYSAQDF